MSFNQIYNNLLELSDNKLTHSVVDSLNDEYKDLHIRNRKCYKCGKYGHIAKTCGAQCDICGKNHAPRNCMKVLVQTYAEIKEKLDRFLGNPTVTAIYKLQQACEWFAGSEYKNYVEEFKKRFSKGYTDLKATHTADIILEPSRVEYIEQCLGKNRNCEFTLVGNSKRYTNMCASLEFSFTLGNTYERGYFGWFRSQGKLYIDGITSYKYIKPKKVTYIETVKESLFDVLLREGMTPGEMIKYCYKKGITCNIKEKKDVRYTRVVELIPEPVYKIDMNYNNVNLGTWHSRKISYKTQSTVTYKFKQYKSDVIYLSKRMINTLANLTIVKQREVELKNIEKQIKQKGDKVKKLDDKITVLSLTKSDMIENVNQIYADAKKKREELYQRGKQYVDDKVKKNKEIYDNMVANYHKKKEQLERGFSKLNQEKLNIAKNNMKQSNAKDIPMPASIDDLGILQVIGKFNAKLKDNESYKKLYEQVNSIYARLKNTSDVIAKKTYRNQLDGIYEKIDELKYDIVKDIIKEFK